MSMEDSSALVQTVARVQDEAQATEDRPKNLVEVVREVGQKLKDQQEKQLAKLEQKLKPLQEKLEPFFQSFQSVDKIAAPAGAAAPPRGENAKAEVPAPREPAVPETEAQTTAQAGKAMTLIVKDPLQRAFSVNFQSSTRCRLGWT